MASDSPRKYDPPVRWLLGLQLLGGLKGILLYIAFGRKIDPREWMTATVLPDANRRKSLEVWQNGCAPEQNSINQPIDPEDFWRQQKEFWFDYLADAGDGTRAMYSVAYLSMCDLWAHAPNDELPAHGRDVSRDLVSGFQKLPRGQFLFFGGDSAYHVADYMTLANRLQRPFRYAFEDLVRNKRINSDFVRPLFGIPGNHDYYDQLDGFRRQFRRPIRLEPEPPPAEPATDRAQLGLPGYSRTQEASYVALRLPFDWWLWGLDTEPGPMGEHQLDFFRSLSRNPDEKFAPPNKLIVATPSPSTAFGKIASEEDFKANGAMDRLGLARPFRPDRKNPDGSYDLSTTGDVQLSRDQCRLDLSGDDHHYARYWGPKPSNENPPRASATVQPPAAQSYASVVSGLGGAFHHPSSTYVDEVPEQALYPSETTSRESVASKVFNFVNIANGGYVWLVGFVIAFTIFFAASVPQSSRQFLSNFGRPMGLGLVQQEPIMPTTERPKRSNPCGAVEPFRLWKDLGISQGWGPPPGFCDPDRPLYFFATTFRTWPIDLKIGQILVFLTLLVMILIIVFRKKIFRSRGLPEAPVELDPDKRLWPPVILTGLLALVGFFSIQPYAEHITPFASSLLVLFAFVVAAGAIALSARYNEYLFKKSFTDYIDRTDWVGPWALWIASVLIVACGLWSIGRNNLPALLVSDTIFTLVFVGAFFLLLLLPCLVGAELFYNLPRAVALVLKIAIGLWHAILQLATPFLLIRRGTWLTWLVAVVLLFLPIPVARFFTKKNWGLALFVLWLVYGGAMLVLPWLTSTSTLRPWFGPSWLGMPAIFPAILAGLVGIVMSCLWFGWYLAVCLLFNGHNNEIGGAARLERFKQFIRFRLRQNDLTAYVIAVDDVSMIGKADESCRGRTKDGEDLKPRLIDVFKLTVKP